MFSLICALTNGKWTIDMLVPSRSLWCQCNVLLLLILRLFFPFSSTLRCCYWYNKQMYDQAKHALPTCLFTHGTEKTAIELKHSCNFSHVIQMNEQVRKICFTTEHLVMRQPGFLIHWGRVMHICVSELAIIGSDNGLSPGRRQAIIWTNAGTLLIGPLGTNFNEMLIEIHINSLKKMHLKMSSGNGGHFA